MYILYLWGRIICEKRTEMSLFLLVCLKKEARQVDISWPMLERTAAWMFQMKEENINDTKT